MFPAGQRADIDERCGSKPFCDAKPGRCRPWGECFPVGGHSQMMQLPSDGTVDQTRVSGDLTGNEGQIRFGDFGTLELPGQTGMSRMIFGDQNNAAGFTVETVDDARSEQGGGPRLSVEHRLHQIRQRPVAHWADRVSDQSSRLVDRQQPRVVVEDFESAVAIGFRRIKRLRRLRQADDDFLSAEDPAGRRARPVVYRHQTSGGHSLHAGR